MQANTGAPPPLELPFLSGAPSSTEAGPVTPRGQSEWQLLPLPREDLLTLKTALEEEDDPLATLRALGVQLYHKPYFRIRTPLGTQVVSHTSAAMPEDAFPSIVEWCQRNGDTTSRAFGEVMELSRRDTQPLLGNLKRITLGQMHVLQTFLAGGSDVDSETSSLRDGTTSGSVGAGGGSANSQAGGSLALSGGLMVLPGGVGTATDSPLSRFGLSVYDRPFCESGAKFGLDNTDVDLNDMYTGELSSVVDFARKHRTKSLPCLLREAHRVPCFEVAGVFADKAVSQRSLCQLICDSTLREDMRQKKLVVAGWLQSGEWKTCRALARHHSVIVIDAEHGAITLDQIAMCLEIMAANGCLGIVRVPFDLDRRKAFARRCLDAGAIGILFPNVQSADEAHDIIQNCYYPSAATAAAANGGGGGGADKQHVSGTRGFGYGGCNQDGAAFTKYAAIANDKVVIGVQLENRAAFSSEVLDGILQTEGLCFTQDGPYDHSGSYGVPGQTSDPRVKSDLALYRQKCGEHGITAGKHVVLPTASAVRAAVDDGYSFVALGTDLVHVMEAACNIVSEVSAILPARCRLVAHCWPG